MVLCSLSNRYRTGATRKAPVLEPLEGRTLLSAFHRSVAIPSPAATVGAAAGLRLAAVPAPSTPKGLRYRGPVNERINGGTVIKHPEFYPLYKGPKVAALDAVGASGRFIHPGARFVFTGRLLGPVDLSQPAYYVFLIDRGGAKDPGPYPRRADIFFDAMAVVSTGPAGVSGKVVLLDQKGMPVSSTPLPASDVRVQGSEVDVTIPSSLVPSTSKDALRYHIGQYRYNFSPRVSPDDPSGFASFVPEYITAPIAKPR